MAEQEKTVKCIVLDAGPLILNEPSLSSLLAKSEQLYSTRSVLAEIRDPAARLRVETTVKSFLLIRDPSPASIRIVSDFARRTGDLTVLSRTDLEVIALAYELECERNGGDWRLRKAPGQKELNGPLPREAAEEAAEEATGETSGKAAESNEAAVSESHSEVNEIVESVDQLQIDPASEAPVDLDGLSNVQQHALGSKDRQPVEQQAQDGIDSNNDPGDSDGEWITATNLASHIAADGGETEGVTEGSQSKRKAPPVLQVATITGDFALQNVLLQMNLNLLSSRLGRVRTVRSHILRCHACFATSRDLNRQFCARCGQPALTRIACSTRDDGSFVLHFKKNYQHNSRGDRYSVPKPVPGTASGKNVKGGGKGGWGNSLILSEDQKEYANAIRESKKGPGKGGLMDEDYLPSILTGKRESASGGRPKVGAGRNVNSRKR